MKFNILTFAAVALLVTSCQKDEASDNLSSNLSSIDLNEVRFPTNFDFSTSRDINAQITVNSLKDQPLGGVRVSIFKEDPTNPKARVIAVGVTNPAGILEMPIRVPAYVEHVHIVAHTAGMANYQMTSAAGAIHVSFGGSPEARNFGFGKAAGIQARSPISSNFYYMGAFSTGTNGGLPSYLESPGDVVSQQFLDDVNASLPERASVPTNNPSYLTAGNELDVIITDESDVWVTFVTEGAGYRNALGYYVFDSNNPPATANDIDSIFVVLPNASLDAAGGALNAGDKVRLGTFEGGKTISWVLFQNAWTGNGVNVNKQKYYSRIDFNTGESDPSVRRHTVQLADIGRQLLLNGFEDQTRSNGGSDNDFNDLVFYVTANPWENVDLTDVPLITPEDDCDGDGVSDESDDFPCDASRAVRNTYAGTLAYEDLWPSQGDYDFNDMVVDYEIDHILNGANKLVEIEADWTVRAVGAGFENGFGFSFDGLSPSVITSVNGHSLDKGIISNASNGTESGQTSATVIAFDNVFNVMPNPGTKFINTVLGEVKAAAATVNNLITFTSPQLQSTVGLPPYNPFIIVNGDRGREVHLANKLPTDLADPSNFGMHGDATNVNAGYTYKTENGLPWAINISESFDYPVEYTPVYDAYLNFSAWATSGGTANTNWFTDEAGNRVASEIYQ